MCILHYLLNKGVYLQKPGVIFWASITSIIGEILNQIEYSQSTVTGKIMKTLLLFNSPPPHSIPWCTFR